MELCTNVYCFTKCIDLILSTLNKLIIIAKCMIDCCALYPFLLAEIKGWDFYFEPKKIDLLSHFHILLKMWLTTSIVALRMITYFQ